MDPCLTISFLGKDKTEKRAGVRSFQLPLFPQPDHLESNQHHSGPPASVLEDGEYDIRLSCDRGAYRTPELFLSGRRIGIVRKPPARTPDGQDVFIFETSESNSNVQNASDKGWKPFRLCYDWIQASVSESGDEDGSSVRETDLFSCRCRDDGTFQNLRAIVKTLVDPDETDLRVAEWMTRRKKEGDDIQDPVGGFVRGVLRTDRPKTLNGFIALVGDVLDCYRHAYSFFRTRAHHKVSQEAVLVPFSKVRTVSPANAGWLMRNAGRLVQTDFETGITIGDRYYLPDRMLSSRRTKDFDFFENQVVVAFIEQIARVVRARTESLERSLSEGSFDLESVFENGANYISPMGVARLWQKRYYEERVNRLKDLASDLSVTAALFRSVLDVTEVPIVGLPRMTKLFQEVSGYRAIYDVMRQWFRFGEFAMTGDSRMLGIKRLDRIFEYYSLFSLLDILRRNGFVAASLEEDCYSFPYDFSRSRPGIHENEREINNTYRLTRDKTTVTVYYESGIFSPCQFPMGQAGSWEMTPNGIELVYLDEMAREMISKRPEIRIADIGRMGFSSKSYVTPDFIVKVVRPDRPDRYIVLDAKYARKDTIKNQFSLELFWKYVQLVFPTKRDADIVSLVLLQGRCDQNETPYRFDRPSFLNAFDYRIVPLTSQEETRNALWSVLSPWIEG